MTASVPLGAADAIGHHLAAFERDGYTKIEHVFTDNQIDELHRMRDEAVRDWRYVTGTTELPETIGDVVERFPRQGLDAITNPRILDLVEGLIGPVVQLDSAVLVGHTPVDPARRGQPVAWHRDRFGFFPLGVYTRPLAIICIAYLQEMTGDVGPLRLIPGSHQQPHAVDLDRRQEHHPDEICVPTTPGDVIALHHNLLHSGTCNVSGRQRRFLGVTYTPSSQLHQDNFDGPNCQALIATARRTNDRRTLRLLGADPLVDPRHNTGFVQPHTAYWPTWRDEDHRHAAEAAEARALVQHAREVAR